MKLQIIGKSLALVKTESQEDIEYLSDYLSCDFSREWATSLYKASILMLKLGGSLGYTSRNSAGND